MHPDITVHHFATGSNSFSSEELLDVAKQIVDDAVLNEEKWVSVCVPRMGSDWGKTQGRCVEWRKSAPVIRGKGKGKARASQELLDWNAPLDEGVEELIDMSKLPDFERTDFNDVIRACQVSPTKRKLGLLPSASLDSPDTSPARQFANDVDMNRMERASKRPRTLTQALVAKVSISELIPFPHYYPPPDHGLRPPLGIKNIPPHRIHKYFPRPERLKVDFARAGWIIPLRGGPRIDGTSTAEIYSQLLSDDIHAYRSEDGRPRHIYWTTIAVTQFWNFLLKQKEMNTFGPISVAYRCDEVKLTSKLKQVASVNGKGRPDKTPKDANKSSTQSFWEYIKIYHEVKYAMRLRSLLDSFRWEEVGVHQQNNTGGTEQNKWRYRVLKDAILVLVDEKGEPLLLS
ncbi:hypothetical protein M422DRAFT_56458 [Sphaerobolus stellatus SS14]|uniref:Uncharacterized protein n=1 Tax=Sphaerobolus stellatus (strain SS14) TaxID=990650 RepID=A0A0C9UGD6_SPHS4|nr:hypothetical protein M422DRAFT_56458 [Sphaerobolus stellatus SS14]